MTPISIGLTLLGLVTLFWPLATLLCKRNVLNAQWLMMLAMTMLAFAFFLLGCLFNTFLQHEYLILILFLDLIIVTPPVIHIALAVLTQPRAISLSVRLLFLPSILTIALMILSVVIGGPDMYLLWAARGLEGLSGAFFPNSWRYNLIVFANFYLFWTVFLVESLFILVTSIRQFLRFKRINAEYYTPDRFHNLNLKAIAIYIGHAIYMINNSAERIPQYSRSRRDPATLARLLEEYVEKEQAFRNPDLSVFFLAEHFHTSEDDIIDAIHYAQGIPFGEYIDSLRVQYCLSVILPEYPNPLNPDTLTLIAHQSGYLTSEARYAYPIPAISPFRLINKLREGDFFN